MLIRKKTSKVYNHLELIRNDKNEPSHYRCQHPTKKSCLQTFDFTTNTKVDTSNVKSHFRIHENKEDLKQTVFIPTKKVEKINDAIFRVLVRDLEGFETIISESKKNSV